MRARTGNGQRLKRTWPQRLVILGNCMLIVVVLGTAASLQLAWTSVRSVRRVAIGNTSGGGLDDAPDTSPQNYLIVGVDSDQGLAPDDPVRVGRNAGGLSDTIMVLRVDPASAQAQILSIPRDLWVTIAGTGGHAKINSAISTGPDRLIATIKQTFGISINHFISIDFAGFEAMVNAVGGVKMNFPAPTRDVNVLGDPIGPGCVALSPSQALALARARHLQVQVNGRWVSDPLSDLGRIDRQQALIRALIQRAIDKGARDPRVFKDLVDGGLKAVTLDARLSVRQILDLGTQFRNFTGDGLVTYQLPTSPAKVGGADVLLFSTGLAQPMLDVFRDVATPADAPHNTLVGVRNGTPDAGRASQVAADLSNAGFNIPAGSAGDASEGFNVAKTTVRYPSDGLAKARLLARYVKGPVMLQQLPFLFTDVDLLIGADWQGVLAAPRPDSSIPGPVALTAATTVPLPSSAAPTAPPTTLPPANTVANDRLIYVPTGC
jgi:polyisoprenyl-teichoic acid--peptidoglycan teichoic acid transferase